MVDLSVEFAGLRLKNPIISGAGPNTKNFDQAVKGIKAGCGAVVMRSLHMDRVGQRPPPRREFWRLHGSGREFLRQQYSIQSTGATAERVSMVVAPGHGGGTIKPSLEEYQEIVANVVKVARQHDCVVIGNIGFCGSRLAPDDLWEAEAKAMAGAGVDAIELHTGPSPFTETGRYIMADPEKYLLNPIRIAKRAGGRPTFPKVPVDCCDVVAACRWAQSAGADGVVPVTRWMSISIDVNQPEKLPWSGPGLGGPWSAPIMTAYIHRMRFPKPVVGRNGSNYSSDQDPTVTVPIIPSGGVRSGAEVISYMMAGASAVQVCAQILVEGYGAVGRITREVEDWMNLHGHSTLDEIKGTLKLGSGLEQRIAWVDEGRCTGCEVCVDPCTDEAITMRDGLAVVDPERCEGCTNCQQICPVDAIEMVALS